MPYEYEIPSVNGKPLVEIPKELKDKVIDYTVLRDKIIIKASDLVDQLLYDTRVKVRDELGRLVKSITEYSYPPTASAIVCKDEDYVYAYRPSNNWKGYILIDKGEAGVDDAEVIQSALESLTEWGKVVFNGNFIMNKTIWDAKDVILEGGIFESLSLGNCENITVKDMFVGALNIYNPAGQVTLDNIKVDGSTTQNHGIQVHIADKNKTVEDLVITKCRVYNTYYTGIRVWVEKATSEIRNLIIYGNIVKNYARSGQYDPAIDIAGRSKYFEIFGNNICGNNNGGDGINLSKYTGKSPIYGSIFGNTIRNVYGTGIVVYEISAYMGLRISDNFIERTGGAGIYCHIVSFVDIIGNRLMNTVFRTDGFADASIIVNGSAEWTSKHITIKENVWLGHGDGTEYAIKAIDYVEDIDVENNYTYGKPINVVNLRKNSGTATFSGDGSTTQFKIAHGLVSTPDKGKTRVWALSADAADNFWIDVDDTYIYVNYKTAPPSGTDNVVLGWYAEV